MSDRKTIYLDDAIDSIVAWTVEDRPDIEMPTDLVDRVNALPSAERKGKWKAKNFHECFCDNCGFTFDIMKCDFLGNMKHCPNCGCEMQRGEEDAM